MKFKTSVGTASSDQIIFYGRDLCKEVIGKIDLGSYAFLCVSGREPSESEAVLVNAVMLASADHGFTPSSIATRMTLLGAPESVQGAIAAGLLGAGSVYLGASELVGRMLGRLLDEGGSFEELAEKEVARANAAGEKLPGFGHPIHRPVDPRTPVLLDLAKSLGHYGDNCGLIDAIHAALAGSMGRPITMNAAAASGAILSDLGVKPELMRLLAVASRAIGLIAHVREEMAQPVAQEMWDSVRDNTIYEY